MNRNWISIHIFYHGDQNALIVNCIGPLVAELRKQGLIRRYFFIKYWSEGPHVRLRLLPAPGADTEKIKDMANVAIEEYIKERPAVYDINPQKVAALYKDLFIMEYGKEKWIAAYGENGSMQLHPNNSFAYIEYEPEYTRYGGPDGVELAEWHFEHSSDTVLDLLRETNVGVHSMLLGRSIQLTLSFFYGVFETDDKVLRALANYINNWQRVDAQRHSHSEQYAKKYQRMAPMLQQRIASIRHDMLEDSPSSKLTETEKSWKRHLIEFRRRIDELYNEQKLTIYFEGRPERATLDEVRHYLQASYVHMTNNRLGVSIAEEIYLAYLLKRSLEDLLAGSIKEAV